MTEIERKALQALRGELESVPFGEASDTQSSAPADPAAIDAIVKAIQESGAKSRLELVRTLADIAGTAFRLYTGRP